MSPHAIRIPAALHAHVTTIRQLARQRECSWFAPKTLQEAEQEINRLLAIPVPRVALGPASPRLYSLCRALSAECQVPFVHPFCDSDARAHITRLKSMKVTTAAMISTRHHRPVYATSGEIDTYGYGTGAYRDLGQSMAADRPAPPSEHVHSDPEPAAVRPRWLDRRAPANPTTAASREPQPAQRAQPIQTPTPAQLRYLARLASQAGVPVPDPQTRVQASAAIDQLLSLTRQSTTNGRA